MLEYSYYPGCSLKGAGKPYEKSFLAVCKNLGLELYDLQNWNCCGATAYFSVDANLATVLAARNLALAEKGKLRDLVAPCSGCFQSLTRAQTLLKEYPELRTKVLSALSKEGLNYQGKVKIRHPLEVLMVDVGPEEFKKRIVRPLKDFKVVPYYGCAILRPFAAGDDPHLPESLEDCITITGATPVDYAYKSRCCGGMLTSGVPNVGLRLVQILLEEAKNVGADAIVTTCALCQYNLECFQDRLRKSSHKDIRVPVMYFTQLLGMALGIDDKSLGMNQLFRKPKLKPEVRA